MRFGVLLAFAVGMQAAPVWIRISSPSAEIFTDSGEKTARAVLHRFEALQAVFRETQVADPASAVRVFIFSSTREFEKFKADSKATGFYAVNEDRDFIVLDANSSLQRVASHEYLHMVIHHASALLPKWLDEGLAEFYSTLAINGNKMRIGEPIPEHLEFLAQAPWLSADDLETGAPVDGPIFYAESWALVHMLSLSPEWKGALPRFVRLLGEEDQDAFETAFGMSMDQALRALRVYVKRPREITGPIPRIETGEYPAARMEAGDMTAVLADLALHTGRWELARTLVLQSAKENPQSAAAFAGLGALALTEDRKEDAVREFERAIALGYRDASVYLDLASLKNDGAYLEKALTVDPHCSEAHFLLGVRATDRGEFLLAISHLRDAVAEQPRRFTFWNALGYAQAKSGDRKGAAESARRATILASNGQEEQIAASLIEMASEEKKSPAAKKAEVTTPASWQHPKGDTRVEGTLTDVNCESAPVRLVVSNAAVGKIELKVQNPTEVELVNADGVSTTLVCGEQSRGVAVEYLAATKDITRIEFKGVVIMKR